MNFNEWAPLYREIMEAFGFSEENKDAGAYGVSGVCEEVLKKSLDAYF